MRTRYMVTGRDYPPYMVGRSYESIFEMREAAQRLEGGTVYRLEQVGDQIRVSELNSDGKWVEVA